MKLGINLMAWSAGVGQAELDLLPGLARLGYDGVELPLLRPDEIEPDAVRDALQQAGLECTASAALPRGASLLNRDEHRAALSWLEQICLVAAECGARLVCGPLYAPVGQLVGRPRIAAEWDACVAGLRTAGDIAGQYGVLLALEPLNRFETYFLNTTADALRLVEEVDHPAIGIHLDTFHMNIEEHDLAAAIRLAGPHLVHFHASENDRGSVGSGHIDWAAIRSALRASGYADLPDHWIVAETFSGVLPELAAAAAVWRPLVADAWTYASESMIALRHLVAVESASE